MKRCGKSAPRPWQHGWQAKPRTEQDQIGRRTGTLPAHVRRGRPSGRPVQRPPGRSLELASDGETRGMTVVAERAARRKARSAKGEQNSAYGSLRHLDSPSSTAIRSQSARDSCRRDLTKRPPPMLIRPRAGSFAAACRADAVLGLAVLAAQQAPLPPGQFRPRPDEGREPQLPPPSIRDYKPRSTLVVPQHPVPKAKFPVIDVHGHPPSPTNTAEYGRVVKSMDDLNLRLMIYAGNNSSDRLAADGGGDQEQPAPGSHGRVHEHRLPRSGRAGLRSACRGAARSRRQGRRARASARS